MMNFIFSSLIMTARALECANDEYLYQGSQCIKCSVTISACFSCSSGQYSDIINSSFEEPELESFSLYTNSLSGWTIEPGKEAELNNYIFYAPQEGNQFSQSASSENYYIYQDLVTEEGYYYQAQFYFSPFPDLPYEQNMGIVYWGDTTKNFGSDGTGLVETNWILIETDIIQATSSLTRLKIQGNNSQNNSLGPFIDNVSYKNVPICSMCYSGYYIYNNSCKPCSDYDENCQICHSECIQCSAGYYLSQGACLECSNCLTCTVDGTCQSCNDGYFLEEGGCLECPIGCSNCESSSICSDCSYSFVFQNNYCRCAESDYLAENVCLSCNSFDRECLSCDSSGCLRCSNSYFVKDGKCSSKDPESENTEEQQDSAYDKEEMVGGISGEESGTYSSGGGVAISAIISLISGNPSTLWTFLNIGSVNYLIPLMNLNMTQGMKDFCKSMGNKLPEAIPSLKTIFRLSEESYSEVSERWKDYGIKTSSFLLNCGRKIVVFFLLLVFLPILCALYGCCRKKSLKRAISQYKWNFFFRFWIQVYVELLTCCCLSISSISGDKMHFEQWMSLFFFVLEILSPILLIYFIFKHRYDLETKTTFRKCSFFADFKRDEGISRMMFYALFFIRRICLVLGIFLLENYPIVQVGMNCGLGVLIVMYLLVFKPFLKKSKLFFNIVSECYLVLVFFVSGLSLAGSSEDYLEILSFFMIGSIALTLFLYFSAAGILIIVFCVSWRSQKKKNIISPRNEQVTIINTNTYSHKKRSQQINTYQRHDIENKRVVSEIY